MAASKPSGPKPTKSFSFEIGCDDEGDGLKGIAASGLYTALIKKAGAAASSLQQGRIVLSVDVYAPAGKKPTTRARAKTARKTPSPRKK